MGERTLGFQNSGRRLGAAHDRSTRQTNSFFPSATVVYPPRPITNTWASAEMAGGAALRARATSASRPIRYFARGAIRGYGEVAAEARDGHSAQRLIASKPERSRLFDFSGMVLSAPHALRAGILGDRAPAATASLPAQKQPLCSRLVRDPHWCAGSFCATGEPRSADSALPIAWRHSSIMAE